MTTLLVKNGTGTPDDRTFFKNVRDSLTLEQQISMADRLGLEYVPPSGTEAAPLPPEPETMEYVVKFSGAVTIEASSKEQAITLFEEMEDEVVGEAVDDYTATLINDDCECEDECDDSDDDEL